MTILTGRKRLNPLLFPEISLGFHKERIKRQYFDNKINPGALYLHR